ncbi:MAG: trypsin-like serine protease [Planctomycetota bacterium]
MNEQEKARQTKIANAAADFAKIVAGSEDSELYTRVLLATIKAGNDAKTEQAIDELEEKIRGQNAKLTTMRSRVNSPMRGVATGTPTPLAGSTAGVSRRMSVSPDVSLPLVVPPSTSGSLNFAPRDGSQGLIPLAKNKEWRKNIGKLIDENGLTSRPRIFNPDDDESRPVTDLLDCVAIGHFGSSGSSCCSGTLIAPNVVLTAAHCVPCNATEIYVGANSNLPGTGRVFSVERVIAHEDFNFPTEYANDIALVVLTGPVSGVLVRERATTAEFDATTSFTVAGFGFTDQGNFGIKLEAPAARSGTFNKEFTAGGVGFDTCQGDSGGPAYLATPSGRFHIAGITSRGGRCGTGGIYTRVDAYHSWIDDKLILLRSVDETRAKEPR